MNAAFSFLVSWVKPGVPVHGTPQAELFLADVDAQRNLLSMAEPFIDAPLCNGKPMAGWSGILRSSPEAHSKMVEAVQAGLKELGLAS